MPKFIEILPDKTALVERSLVLVLEKIQSAIQERGLCTIALSGGSTPKPLYQALSRQVLPWDQLHVFWGDERYVSADHPDSNQKMAREAWLNQIPIPATHIHSMPTGAENPALDAQTHEQELRQFFHISGESFPVFDIVLLGMGDDGHTASLFPHTEVLTSDRLVDVGNKDGQPRLTLTVPVINHSRCVIFLVAGTDKQPALAQVFAEVANEMTYPARLIQPQGELWWLLDQSAGSKLNS